MEKSTYEELLGGVGRRIFFRAERYRARAFLDRIQPILYVDDVPFPIHAVSMNGVTFYVPSLDDTFEVGKQVPMRENHQKSSLAKGFDHVHQGL